MLCESGDNLVNWVWIIRVCLIVYNRNLKKFFPHWLCVRGCVNGREMRRAHEGFGKQ